MSRHELGDAPIEPEYVEKMNALARAVDAFFNGEPEDRVKGQPRKTGFVLMVFPFDGFDGRCNYISNGADRKDIVIVMKEMIQRFEGQPEMEGRA